MTKKNLESLKNLIDKLCERAHSDPFVLRNQNRRKQPQSVTLKIINFSTNFSFISREFLFLFLKMMKKTKSNLLSKCSKTD